MVATGEKYGGDDRCGRGDLGPSRIIQCRGIPLPPASSCGGSEGWWWGVEIVRMQALSLSRRFDLGCKVVAVQVGGIVCRVLGAGP